MTHRGALLVRGGGGRPGKGLARGREATNRLGRRSRRVGRGGRRCPWLRAGPGSFSSATNPRLLFLTASQSHGACTDRGACRSAHAGLQLPKGQGGNWSQSRRRRRRERRGSGEECGEGRGEERRGRQEREIPAVGLAAWGSPALSWATRTHILPSLDPTEQSAHQMGRWRKG